MVYNTIVEIPVIADTYVTSNKPTSSWGQDSTLYLGYDLLQNNDGAERILLKFDINNQVPTYAVINSAYIEIYEINATPPGDSAMGNVMRHLNSDWDANAVTWNSHEPNWGGVDEQGQVGSNNGWQQFPVTGLVQEWFNGYQPNYDAIIIGDENVQERQRVFHSLNANNSLYPRIVVDYSVSTDTTAPYVTVDSLPTYVGANFTVTWGGSDNSGGSGIAYYDVQYQRSGLGWQDWQMHTTNTSATFNGGQNGSTYQFRSRAVDNAGNAQPFDYAQTQTIVDSVAPQIAIDPLPEYTFSSAFNVTWSVSDNSGGSGMNHYDVQYKVLGGTWQDWLLNTLATSAQFTGGQDGVTYRFRARGVDNVGNAQPLGDHQAETTLELNGPTSIVLPLGASISSNPSFTVSWAGYAEPGKTILYYNVYYRFNNGNRQLWESQTEATSATFTALQGDGFYQFEVSAADSIGLIESLTDQPEAGIVIDAVAPFIEPQFWIPVFTIS